MMSKRCLPCCLPYTYVLSCGDKQNMYSTRVFKLKVGAALFMNHVILIRLMDSFLLADKITTVTFLFAVMTQPLKELSAWAVWGRGWTMSRLTTASQVAMPDWLWLWLCGVEAGPCPA